MSFLRNAKISAPIALALVLPILGLVVFSGMTVMDKRQTVSETQDVASNITGKSAGQVLKATKLLTTQSDALRVKVEKLLGGIKAA